MKQAWGSVKSYVTILFSTSLVALLFIAVFKGESLFETVFLLFTNLCTAVFTYFFTKKDKESTSNEDALLISNEPERKVREMSMSGLAPEEVEITGGATGEETVEVETNDEGKE